MTGWQIVGLILAGVPLAILAVLLVCEVVVALWDKGPGIFLIVAIVMWQVVVGMTLAFEMWTP